MDKLILFKGNRKMIVGSEDILYLKAENNYTKVALVTGEHLLSGQCLKRLEEVIQSSGFFRIHRKYSINLDHLKEFTVNGELFVLLRNGETIPISARKKPAFVAKVREYLK